MARSLVAFDAGSFSLKMAVFSAEKNRLQLTDFDVSPLSVPAEASLDERHRIIARQMRASLSLKKVKTNSVLVSISGQSVFTRFVKLPAVEEAKVSQIIRYEAQQQVPFPIEDVEWDHNIIGKTPSGEIDIVLVAVKNDVIASFTSECSKMGIDISAVDVAPLCVYNCLRHAEQEFAECTAVIDFGAKAANLIISEGDDLWARTIPIGGDDITAAIAKELNLDDADAEKLKLTAWVPGTSAGEPEGATEQQRRASNVVGSFISRMFAELSRSVGFYRSQAGHSPIRRILLSGGSSRLNNFKDFLSDRFKVDVAWLSPLNRVAIGRGVDRGELNRHAELLAGVIGLGLRGAEMSRIRINLLPKTIARQKELSRKKVLVVAAGWLLVATLLVMTFGKKIAHGDNSRAFNTLVSTISKTTPGVLPSGPTLREQREELESIYASDSTKATEIRKIRDEIRKIGDQVDAIAVVQQARLRWTQLIEALKTTKQEVAGKGQRNYIWLTGLRITENQMVAAEYVDELRDMSRGMYRLPSTYRAPTTASRSQKTKKKAPGAENRPWVIITGYIKIPPEASGQQSAVIASARAEAFKNALEVMGEKFVCSKDHAYREDKSTGALYPISADTGPAKAYRFVWDESAGKVILEGLMEDSSTPTAPTPDAATQPDATPAGPTPEGAAPPGTTPAAATTGGTAAAATTPSEETPAPSENWKVLASYKTRTKPDWINESGIKGDEILCPIDLAISGASTRLKCTRTGGYLDEVYYSQLEPPLPRERVARFKIVARLAELFDYPKKSEML